MLIQILFLFSYYDYCFISYYIVLNSSYFILKLHMLILHGIVPNNILKLGKI